MLLLKRIVLGNPDTVPAGNYGKQVLRKLGVWDQVEPNVVYAKDVKAVTASISQAAGDAGFIYKTDAIAAGDAVEIAAVTPADLMIQSSILSVLLRNMIMLWLKISIHT